MGQSTNPAKQPGRAGSVPETARSRHWVPLLLAVLAGLVALAFAAMLVFVAVLVIAGGPVP